MGSFCRVAGKKLPLLHQEKTNENRDRHGDSARPIDRITANCGIAKLFMLAGRRVDFVER